MPTPRIELWVAGLSLDQLVAWGVLYYAYTVLSVPIAADLHISRLHVAAAFSVCLLVAGWTGRHVGALLDVRGTRDVLRLGAIAAPLAFSSLVFASGAFSLVALFALLGMVQAFSLYEPAFRTIVDWCPEEPMRARATLGLTLFGGLASAIFLPLTGFLQTEFSWRGTVLVLSTVLGLVIVPLRFSLPFSKHGRARRAPSSLASPTSAKLLSAGLSLHSLASTGAFVYLMWHLVERGNSVSAAAAIAGFAGAAQVPGRLVTGPLRRLVGSAAFLPLLLLVQASALLGSASFDGALSTVHLLAFGAANGMMTLERATILVEWYGRSTFGAQQGRLAAATNTARAVSPFAVEGGHHFVSYAVVFGILGGVLALGALLCRAAARRHLLERS